MSNTREPNHHRWSEMPQDHPMERIGRRRIVGEKAMLAQVHAGKGCVVPSHRHENEQFVCVLSGRLRLGIGLEGSEHYREVVVSGGEVLHLPPNVPHGAEALEDTVVLDVFSPPGERTGVDR